MREIAQCFKKYGFESDKDLTYKCTSDFTIEDAEKALDNIKLALINDECFINIIKNSLNDKENVFFLYSERIEQLLLHFIDLENKNPCIVYNYLTWDNLYEDGRLYFHGGACDVNEAYTAPTISQVLEWFRGKDFMAEITFALGDDGTWKYSYRVHTKKFISKV